MGAQGGDEVTVLVVDDEPAVGKALKRVLAQEGMQTVSVRSAERALEVLSSQSVQLLVTDMRMPDIDGFELLAQVKQRWPSLPVVLLTSYGTVALAVEAMRRGATDFLLKPFERGEIVFMLRKALGRRAHLSEIPEAVPTESDRPPAAAVEAGWTRSSPSGERAVDPMSQAALEHIGGEAFIVDAEGNLLHANAAAVAALARDSAARHALLRAPDKAPHGVLVTVTDIAADDGPPTRLIIVSDPQSRTEHAVREAARRYALTPRECAVFEHLVQGASNLRIGHLLGCSERTVEIHVTNLLRKMGCFSRAEAIALALR